MATKREYLVSLGLAKEGRGKFSGVALAALAEAEAKGIVFDVPVVATPKPKEDKKVSLAKPAAPVPTPPVVKQVLPDVNPKEVRAWAKGNGHAVGERGRIHPNVIQAYLKAGGRPSTPTARRVPTPADMPKVRPNTIAWALAKHKHDKPSAQPLLIGTHTCGKGHRISVCTCEKMTLGAIWNNAPLSLVRPSV